MMLRRLVNLSVVFPPRICFENFSTMVFPKDHIAAITGNKGSGKTFLVRLLMQDKDLVISGEWYLTPKVGYLDQFYPTLDWETSLNDNLKKITPNLTQKELQKDAVDFGFLGTYIMSNKVKFLSGGEKVCLALANIALNLPELLILDEITNNLDLETKGHIIDILKHYPAALMVISHDELFLQQIEATPWLINPSILP